MERRPRIRKPRGVRSDGIIGSAVNTCYHPQYRRVVDLILEVLKVQKHTRDTVGTRPRRGEMHLLAEAHAVTAHAPDDVARELARAFLRLVVVPRRGIRGGRGGMRQESSSFVLDVNYAAGNREK